MKKLLFALFAVVMIAACSAEPRPKYVFLFIGDGMGLAQVSATQAYLAARGDTALAFTQFPVVGLAKTHSANRLVTCSSAAATALATGSKTNNNMLGVGPDSQPLIALTYPLHAAGYRIGIATSVSIDHATPAGFYAHSLKRSNYYDIAKQASRTGFEFFAGSGFLKNEDEILTEMSAAGYKVLRGKAGVAQTSAQDGKVVVVQDTGIPRNALPYAIDRKASDLALTDITRAAIAMLDNPKGFFVMIEGGKIDWAAHDNDGAAVVREVVDMSQAVQVAVDFYRKHPSETLIVVTADHETGGMSVGCCGEYNFKPLVFDQQTRSSTDGNEDMVRTTNELALCGWTSGGHTGIMVPVYSLGAGSGRMGGVMDNTDIPKRIAALMGVE